MKQPNYVPRVGCILRAYRLLLAQATDIAPQPNVRFRKYSVSRRRPVYSPNTRRVCSIRISSAVPLAALRLNCIRTRRGPPGRRAADATGSECHALSHTALAANAQSGSTTGQIHAGPAGKSGKGRGCDNDDAPPAEAFRKRTERYTRRDVRPKSETRRRAATGSFN